MRDPCHPAAWSARGSGTGSSLTHGEFGKSLSAENRVFLGGWRGESGGARRGCSREGEIPPDGIPPQTGAGNRAYTLRPGHIPTRSTFGAALMEHVSEPRARAARSAACGAGKDQNRSRGSPFPARCCPSSPAARHCHPHGSRAGEGATHPCPPAAGKERPSQSPAAGPGRAVSSRGPVPSFMLGMFALPC